MKRTGLLQNYYVKEYNELTREEIQEIDKQVNDPEYTAKEAMGKIPDYQDFQILAGDIEAAINNEAFNADTNL